MRRELDRTNLAPTEDWYGNNIAFACPVCSRVYIVSAQLDGGERSCPQCARSQGFVRGGKESGGFAGIVWWDEPVP